MQVWGKIVIYQQLGGGWGAQATQTVWAVVGLAGQNGICMIRSFSMLFLWYGDRDIGAESICTPHGHQMFLIPYIGMVVCVLECTGDALKKQRGGMCSYGREGV